MTDTSENVKNNIQNMCNFPMEVKTGKVVPYLINEHWA